MGSTKTSRTRTSVQCQLEGHDWYRHPQSTGKKSGHKHCWRCGRAKRSR